ncbi:MAG: hypothetical protein AW06_000383 [Candidatus Accumulibacter cognatus]|uniref:Uncharacterized protein n=1 Tax=Candidatus Accumulibacter cognatus TaxID=2954383 RepID=A0A080MAE2_9PROT|nr:MAG: hypothetical protein AW06_000383 [Candidatus Accumulibacter cognatus]
MGSVFFMQSPSFLDCQRTMQETLGKKYRTNAVRGVSNSLSAILIWAEFGPNARRYA